MAIKKISANLLGGNAVLAANIAGGAISAADIADNSITAAKISTSTFAIDSLTVNTSDLVVDTANNRVGIGTSSPATLLDVSGTTPTITISDSQNKSWTSSDTIYGKVSFKTLDGSGIGAHETAYVGVHADIASSTTPAGRLVFGTSNSNTAAAETMTLDGNGFLGLGTSNPNQLLHLDNSTNTTDEAIIRIISGNAGLSGIYLGDPDYGSISRIRHDHSDNTLQFWGSNVAGTSSLQRMTIAPGGDIGIGDSNPNVKLVVSEASGDTALAINDDRSNVADYARIDFRHNNITGSQIKSQAIEDFSVSANRTSDLSFHTRNNGTIIDAMHIQEDGNVGIGNTSPSANLDVKRDTNTANNIDSTGFDFAANIGNAGSNPGNHYSSGLRLYQGSGTIGSGLGVMYLGADNGTATVANQYTAQVRSPSGMTGGLHLSSDDSNGKIKFTVNGSERMRIDSSGVVAIGYSGGTITGGGILSVNGQGVFRNDGAGYVQGSILLHSGTNDTPSYRGQGIYTYNEGHDVSWYIGTPYTNGDLFTINRQHSTTSWDGAAAHTTGTNVSNFFAIKNSGEVGVGIESPTSPFHVNATYAGYVSDFVQGGSGGGNHGLRVVSGSASSYTAIFRANAATVFYVDGSGNYYFSGSNQSDLNKKENIADLTDNALDLITQLQPKTYNFIGNDIDKAGFIAQEMEQVIPRLVSGNEFDPDATDEDGNNPTGKGIDYMGYTAYLTKAIQEQQTIIDDLKSRLDEAGL